MVFVALSIFFILAWILYAVYYDTMPDVRAQGIVSDIIHKCRGVHRRYIPPYLLLHGQVHTLLGNYRRRADIEYTRHVIQYDDGGTGALDYVNPPGFGNEDVVNTVIVLPGITGSRLEFYCSNFVRLMLTRGWRCVVLNARGLGDMALTSPYVFTATDSMNDVTSCINTCTTLFPSSPLYGAGFSLGSIIIANHAGKMADRCKLRGVVGIGSPFDLNRSLGALNASYVGRQINRHLAKRLKDYADRNWSILSTSTAKLNRKDIDGGEYIQDYDRAVQCPMWGFVDEHDYYDHACVNRHMMTTTIPLIFISARDDPFLDTTVLPSNDDVARNSNIGVISTRFGGHLAWVNSWLSPRSAPSFGEELACELFVNMSQSQ